MAREGSQTSNLVAFDVAIIVLAIVFVPTTWFFTALVIAPLVVLAVSAWLSYSTQPHAGKHKKQREE